EYVHRVLAMLVGLMTLGLAVAVYASPRYRRPLGATMGLALVVLLIQIFMGGRVVLEELLVQRVVVHLLLAFLFFAIMLRLTLRARDVAQGTAIAGGAGARKTRQLRAWSHAAAGLVFLQAGLGAWVSSSGAALACPDFPTCQGTFFPRMAGLVGIHYSHRLGGYLVFAAVGAFPVRAAPVSLPAA